MQTSNKRVAEMKNQIALISVAQKELNQRLAKVNLVYYNLITSLKSTITGQAVTEHAVDS